VLAPFSPRPRKKCGAVDRPAPLAALPREGRHLRSPPAPRTRLSYTFARENPEISRALNANCAILVQARNIMDGLPKSMPAHVPRGLRQVWELAAARFALFNIKRDIASGGRSRT
jgi:hypothetical protein